jgi:hypothetical protein
MFHSMTGDEMVTTHRWVLLHYTMVIGITGFYIPTERYYITELDPIERREVVEP